MKELRRIISITFRSEDIQEINCPFCKIGKIRFAIDNFEEDGEKIECDNCKKIVTVRTLFTNL